MNMQYLVKTGGEIREVQGKTYVVNAHSKQEAQRKANDAFCEDYSVINSSAVYTSDPYSRTKNAIIAIVLMLIPICISMLKKRWFADDSDIYGIPISPDFFSTTMAAMIYLAFVVKAKGIQRTIGSIIDICLAIVCILLVAVLIKCVLTERIFTFKIDLILKTIEQPIHIDTRYIFVLGVIFSWLGIKLASTICMVITGLLGVMNFITLSDAMGLLGIVFSLCAIFGLLFYLSIEPAVYESVQEIGSNIASGIKKDKDKDVIEDKSDI